MSIYFFDASAVVKYFHREPGTAWVRQVVDARAPHNEIYIADISLAEVPAALAREAWRAPSKSAYAFERNLCQRRRQAGSGGQG